jgi:phosphoglycolate phosphatase-like HAD superfamily hydrolase
VTTLRAIVLDFDGVIVESNDVKTAAFEAVFARFPEHHDAMMAFHHANVSMSRFAKFDYLLRERLGRADDDTLRDELAIDFSRRTVDLVVACPFVSGAETLLAEFSARIPLYLTSVTPQGDLGAILERRNLRHFFVDIYGCPPWKKDDAIRDVLRRERCEPSEVVLVGDSEGDRLAAASARVGFVARDSGLPFEQPPSVLYRELGSIADHLRPRLS